MSQLLAGIDLGTSAVKVGIFDRGGRLLSLARESYPFYAPQPGWAEQEPEAWWTATVRAIRRALAEVDSRQVVGVGLSGQAPSQVLLAHDARPLGRAILWSDRRATTEAAWLAAHISPEQAKKWTGYSFIHDVTQPPARLRWLKRHRPKAWEGCAAVVQPKDFIAARLTGRIASDCYSSFALYDPETGRYQADYLALLGVEPDKLPPILSPTDVVGTITPAAAAASGLSPGLPVVSGTIDAWCDILGCGGVAPGRAVDIAGSSEVVALVTDRRVDGEGVFGSPLLGDLYWVGGPMQIGGDALLWLAGLLGHHMPDLTQMEVEAAAAPPGADALLFLPYLRGERAPRWDTQARGALVGLTDRHGQPHLARAVYEGVAFAVRDVLARCQAAANRPVETVSVSGGATRSTLWNQIKADVLGVPVQQMAVPDAACLGAALLAGLGLNIFSSPEQAAGEMVHPAEVVLPRPEYVARYQALFHAWQGLYPALKPTFGELSAICAASPGDCEAHCPALALHWPCTGPAASTGGQHWVPMGQEKGEP